MATTLPEVHSSSIASTVSPGYMERLEELAHKHGWTLDEALSRAVSLTEVVLGAKEKDPNSKLSRFQRGKRFAIELNK